MIIMDGFDIALFQDIKSVCSKRFTSHHFPDRANLTTTFTRGDTRTSAIHLSYTSVWYACYALNKQKMLINHSNNPMTSGTLFTHG